MSRAIRFTEAERAAVESAIHWADDEHVVLETRAVKALVSLLGKMDRASEPAPATAADFVAVRASTFARLADEILGERVFLPPNPSGQWWGRLQAALTSQGIDYEGARAALEHVATWARQSQDLQGLARNASRYLHAARNPRESHDGEVAVTGRPPELR